MNTNETSLMKLNNTLLKNIKKHLPELEVILNTVNKDYTYGDMVYRFYHGSLKVYGVQEITLEIAKALRDIAPEGTSFVSAREGGVLTNPQNFNFQFEEIFQEGTGKKFCNKHNKKWNKHTRPMLEAFFHAKYFLEMAVKYGKELEKAPIELPSGWAGLLYFYNLR